MDEALCVHEGQSARAASAEAEALDPGQAGMAGSEEAVQGTAFAKLKCGVDAGEWGWRRLWKDGARTSMTRQSAGGTTQSPKRRTTFGWRRRARSLAWSGGREQRSSALHCAAATSTHLLAERSDEVGIQLHAEHQLDCHALPAIRSAEHAGSPSRTQHLLVGACDEGV